MGGPGRTSLIRPVRPAGGLSGMGYPMGERKRGSGAPGLWHYRSDPMAWRRTFRGIADQVTAARVLAKTLFAGTGREDDVASIVADWYVWEPLAP